MTESIELEPASGRAQPGTGFTARVVSEVAKISGREVSETVVERARHAVLDWLGVTIAGAQQESAKIARKVLKLEGGGRASHVIGTSTMFTARQAALAGGIAGHSMDYDDMGIGGGHPSVVLLPGIFAVAEEVDADGLTTLEAMLWGYQTMELVAAACSTESYSRGFHCTGTFGAFAATVGVGRLLGLDPVSLQRALGIAGTQASGLKANFGTMSKHLTAGNAAAVGVLSARLAEAGFTGATNVIESPQGFAVAHNNAISDFDTSRENARVGKRLAIERIVFKGHAACGGTHSAIEGIRWLKEQHAFRLEDVDFVELVVSHELPQVCGIPEPQTGAEGMFSLRHAATLALTDSTTGPSAFTDEMVRRPALVGLRKRVRVTPVSRITSSFSTEVKVHLLSGEVLLACIDTLTPTPDDQLESEWRKLTAKFRGLVEPILGVDAVDDVIVLVRRIGSLESIRELTLKTAARG